MLRIYTSPNAAAAVAYFNSGLSQDEYYSEKGEIPGGWHGKLAGRLSLSGEVTAEQFRMMAFNLDPVTGGSLTPRNDDDRRPGYDINFSAPKALSVLYAQTQDQRIIDHFRKAVRDTMEEMERHAYTRVRKGGANTDRCTGNLVWAEYIHMCARPKDGWPDPQLHAHCYTFNATWDEAEGQIKALENKYLKTQAPYFEAAFHARLAREVQTLGYQVERTADRWTISGIPRETCLAFSRRTQEIEAEAERRGITDVDDKAALGARLREKKDTCTLSFAEIQDKWQAELANHSCDPVQLQEGNDLDRVKGEPGLETLFVGVGRDVMTKDHNDPDLDPMMVRRERTAFDLSGPMTAQGAVAFAATHHLERNASIEKWRLMETALEVGVGQILPEEVHAVLEGGPYLEHSEGGRTWVTTRAIRAEEKAMVEFARLGKGKCAPLGPRDFAQAERSREGTKMTWNKGQKEAIAHIHQSTDRVVMIEGGAGVGKTTLMREAVRGIKHNGKKVFAFAPSAAASRGVMRAEGFEEADTIASLLVNKKLQQSLQGQVIWIDEAGMVGSRTMKAIFDVAKAQKARVILTGDTRQHKSVERGDAMKLLRTRAGLKVPRVSKIIRQAGATAYRAAVDAMSHGHLDKGLRLLDEMGAVLDHNGPRRHTALAEDYLQQVRLRRSVLVVSPTHKEGEAVTAAIRIRLREDGRLGEQREHVTQLQDLKWTGAEKQDAIKYHQGMVVQCIRKIGTLKRGTRLTVEGVMEGKVRGTLPDGTSAAIPLSKSNDFSVMRQGHLELVEGDRLMITQNGYAHHKGQKKRLNNGAIYTVKSFDTSGNIILNNGWVMDRGYGALKHGYVATSHAAQGKTVHTVLVAQGKESFPASSMEQFYVTISRGKKAIRIYTDDREGLRKAVARHRPSVPAMDFREQTRRVRKTRKLRTAYRIYRRHWAKAVKRITGRSRVRRIVSGRGRRRGQTPTRD